MSVGEVGVAWCPHCRGWAPALGRWVVPHLKPGRRPRVCAGSSEEAAGEVLTPELWRERVRRERGGCRERQTMS